jgi:RNA polymerase sigma-70 factor (ECF subfamily)
MKIALSRVRATDDMKREIVQELAERLVVGKDGRPRVLDYKGKGPLAAWVRSCAVRAALDARKKKTPDLAKDDDDPAAALATPEDPEMMHMLHRYGDAFRAAFRDAFAELSDGDRAVLRMSIVERLGIDGIAAVLGVHRATAARWATQARETLASRTNELLSERLDVSPSELDSIARMCDSVVDLSVCRILGDAPGNTGDT